jgi:regulator of sigma E protease
VDFSMLVSFVAALTLADLWWWIVIIVKVAVALGAVVFVHELGHFLVAKACGVKIEKFMIGFDIGGYKISRKWNDTVYGIGILPLGGYVKMLGQDDDPSHIAEQMQKSQVDAASANAKEIVGPSGEKYYVDRRSYLAKSVPQRMAIISAGVVMNLIFAFVFAVVAYGIGVEYLPCVVSETVPGSPAWQADLQPGDEIVQIGDRRDPTFIQLKSGVTLGNLEEGLPVVVRRAATGKDEAITLRPTQIEGELASVGIGGPLTVTLRESMPVIEDSPAARARLVSPNEKLEEGGAKFKSGDKIVRIGASPVTDYRSFAAILAQNPVEELLVHVEREATQKKSVAQSGAEVQMPATQELVFEVPMQPFRQFGLVLKMGPIAAVQKNSPAETVGLKPGDRILLVDGKPMADAAENQNSWTALTLPELLRRAAVEGREVEFVVERKGSGDMAAENLTIRVMPRQPIMASLEIPLGTPVAADAVGIAYHVENEVHAVLPSGPAAGTELAAGDRLVSATIHLPPDKDGRARKPQEIELGPGNYNWPAIVDAVQFAPAGTEVEVRFVRGDDPEPQTVKLSPQPADGIFIAPRGFLCEPIFRMREAKTFGEQVRYGWEETVDALTMVFRFLQKLGGQVPLKMLGGPGTIAVAAGGAASQGLSSLLIFLTVLSANLAVINFLPIPLLDGGHMVFLAYEGIRGRPANEKFVLALHMAGFVFIIGLMMFVIGLDIQRWLLP